MKTVQPPLLALVAALALGACAGEVTPPELVDGPRAELGKSGKKNRSNSFRFLEEGVREWRWWGFNQDDVDQEYCQATIPGYDADDYVADYRTYIDGEPQKDGSLHVVHHTKDDGIMLAKNSAPTRLGGSLWWPGFDPAEGPGDERNLADWIGRTAKMTLNAWAAPIPGTNQFSLFNMTFTARGVLSSTADPNQKALVECNFNRGHNTVTITPLN